MSILSKVLVLVNLLLGVAFLAVSCVLFSQQDEWKGKYNATNEASNQLLKEKDKAIAERDDIVKARIAEISSLQVDVQHKKQEIADEQTKSADLRGQIAKADTEKADLNDTNKELASTVSKVQKDAENTQQRLTTVQTSLDAANTAKATADDEVLKLTEQIGDFKLKIDNLTKSTNEYTKKLAEQDKIIAAVAKVVPGGIDALKGSAAKIAPPIDAKVEEVDDASGIVVISVGSEDKVERGFTFYVYREDSYVGQVEVDKVFASKSAARVNKEMTLNKIQAGDGATTRVGSF